MEVKFYQAECGDAARIRFLGNDNLYHNIFIDSGFERTFRFILEEEIKQIEKNKEQVDLWIITHIHDDHIGGVLKYLKLIKTGELNDIVDEWYYNVPRFYSFVSNDNSNISRAVSINQGDILYEYLKNKNKLSERDFTSELPTMDFFGLKITALSPSVERLSQLRNKYPIDINNEFEKIELITISDAKSVNENDYKIELNDFLIVDSSEDTSVENASSISFIIEYANKTILWLSDSLSSEIANSLKNLGFSPEVKLKCDFVKVSHHGSDANNSSELYDLIECDNYIVSVNGKNKHNLPSKKCLAKILRNRNRKTDSFYNIYFNYDNEVLRSIFKIDGDNIFQEFNFNVNYSNDKWLRFIL